MILFKVLNSKYDSNIYLKILTTYFKMKSLKSDICFTLKTYLVLAIISRAQWQRVTSGYYVPKGKFRLCIWKSIF